jgi:NADH-quinone oxidoreductase subunit J
LSEAILFYLLAAWVTGLSLVVVTRPNPLAAAMALLGVLGGVAGLFGLLSAPLVAALQVLVYAGGVLVLMVSVLMMLRLDPASLRPYGVSPKAMGWALLGSMVALVAPLVVCLIWEGPRIPAAVSPSFGGLEAAAAVLFGESTLAFEALSFVLLSALVGALVLTKRRL